MKKIAIILIFLLISALPLRADDFVIIAVFTPDANTTYIGKQAKRAQNWEAYKYVQTSSTTMSVGCVRGDSRATWLQWLDNYASVTYSDASLM